MAETKLSDDLLEEIWAYIADGTRWVRKSVLESWHTRVSQLEQTIDGLCAANEQANALLGEEIERRELAEARLAALDAPGDDKLVALKLVAQKAHDIQSVYPPGTVGYGTFISALTAYRVQSGPQVILALLDRLTTAEGRLADVRGNNRVMCGMVDAEQERRTLAEAVSMRLASLVIKLAAGETAPNITERTTQRELVAEIECETREQAADALRKDGEAK